MERLNHFQQDLLVLEDLGFAGRLFSTKSDIQSWKDLLSLLKDAILGGQFVDDIKTTSEFLPQIILIKQILGIMIQQKMFDPAFSRAVTLENKGEKSDPDPGMTK